MHYFARISNQTSPANQLQKYLLSLVEKFNNIATEEPEALLKQIEDYTKQANYTYKRCLSQSVRTNRDYQTKTITSITVGVLVTLSLHKITGVFPASKAPTAPVQPDPPTPTPQAEPAPTDQPRQAIQRSRTDDTPERFVDWSKFNPRIQLLLKQGLIWAIYYDEQKQIIAEQYGGHTQAAF